MVKCRFAPMKIDLLGFDFEGLEDFQNFIKQLSDNYGQRFGVFCVVLQMKHRKAVDKLLSGDAKAKPIKALKKHRK